MIGVMYDENRQVVFAALTVGTQLELFDDLAIRGSASFLSRMGRPELWSMFINHAWDDKVVEIFRSFNEGERWRTYHVLNHDTQDRVERLCARSSRTSPSSSRTTRVTGRRRRWGRATRSASRRAGDRDRRDEPGDGEVRRLRLRRGAGQQARRHVPPSTVS